MRTLEAEGSGITALASALQGPLGVAFSTAVELIRGASGRVIVTGLGKSGHVARKIAATLASTGTPALFVHPAEASHGDLGMIVAGDAVLALSNSGETAELADVVLPAAIWGEKTGCCTNIDRTVHISHKAIDPPGDCLGLHVVRAQVKRQPQVSVVARRPAAVSGEPGRCSSPRC